MLAGLILVHLAYGAWGHGRLVDPPGRSTMWRYGFHTPVNYNDNELFCGGFARQWNQNGGKCGICGDPWDEKPPRQNELGGLYGKGIVTRRYKSGKVMIAEVEITANHKGYFEFRLCPVNPGQEADQSCLDKYLLRLADGSGSRYIVPVRTGLFRIPLWLPPGLVCKRCVFQWKYTAGNSWGMCSEGYGRTGCGPQENFRSCADIQIVP